MFDRRQRFLYRGERRIELSRPGQTSRQNTKELGIANMPAGLIAGIEHSAQQRGSPRELAALDHRLSFPVTRKDSPKSRVEPHCDIAHRRHTLIGAGDIARQQGDRTHGMVQDPAKREPGIGGLCLFETYPGLLFGLIHMTLQTKHTCQSRPGEHALVVLKQDFVPPVRRRNVVFNHAFEAIPRPAQFTIE